MERREGEISKDVEITVSENGPYLVKGEVHIKDADGEEFISRKNLVALCRCGGSKTKPYCDGTHSKVGFEAAERAVAERERRAG